MIENTAPARSVTLWTILLACVAAVVAVMNTGGPAAFSGPMMGSGDAALWEYLGSFTKEHFSLFPFPAIEYVTDSAFYPYGINAVFQAWGFERDLFLAAMLRLAGDGPWLQCYYTLSGAIIAAGSFALLRHRYSQQASMVMALLLSCFNLYAQSKYPGHFNMTIIHWTTLSIIHDHILAGKLTDKIRLTFRDVGCKALLLLLCLGQDLGYIAGCAFTSFAVHGLFAAAVTIQHSAANGTVSAFIRWLKSLWHDCTQAPVSSLMLFTTIIFFAWLYISLTLNLLEYAGRLPQTAESGILATSPLRLLIPYLPFFHPSAGAASTLGLTDSPESVFSGSPGLFFVLSAIAGIALSPRRKTLIPLVILFALFVAQLAGTDLLMLLPWHSHSRTCGRFTLFLPVILLLMGAPLFSPRKYKITAAFISLPILLLAVTELHTFNSIRPVHTATLTPSAAQYFETIRNTQGSAVLDWPFCIAGGNGVGTAELGAFYGRNSHIAYYNRFHGKSVMGLYLGRLYPEQLDGYRKAGWSKMFMPDDPNPFKAKRQIRPMDPLQWQFFTTFAALGDFCGISLYPELLHPDDVEKILAKYGNPAATTTLPGVGKAMFLPVNKQKHALAGDIKDLVFLPVWDGSPVTVPMWQLRHDIRITLTGIEKPELAGNAVLRPVSKNGTTVYVNANTGIDGTLYVDAMVKPESTEPFSFTAAIVNGKPVQGTFPANQIGFGMHIPFTTREGINSITLFPPQGPLSDKSILLRGIHISRAGLADDTATVPATVPADDTKAETAPEATPQL